MWKLSIVALIATVWVSSGSGSFEDYPALTLDESEVKEAAEARKKIVIAMTNPEVAFFIRKIKESTSYFEFGCGGSTMVAATYGPSDLNITSVDSSEEWISAVLQNDNCKEKVSNKRMLIQHVNIGPTGAWGHPTQTMEESNGSWYHYSQAITKAGGNFDTVLVDGRFRVACVLNTFLTAPNAKVLLHDFFEPVHHKNYRVLLNVADVVERVGTLVQLKRKESVSQADLKKMYEAFMFIPHRR